MSDVGYYTVDLYKDDVFYASRTIGCGPRNFKNACAQWKRKGFEVVVKKTPKESS